MSITESKLLTEEILKVDKEACYLLYCINKNPESYKRVMRKIFKLRDYKIELTDRLKKVQSPHIRQRQIPIKLQNKFNPLSIDA